MTYTADGSEVEDYTASLPLVTTSKYVGRLPLYGDDVPQGGVVSGVLDRS